MEISWIPIFLERLPFTIVDIIFLIMLAIFVYQETLFDLTYVLRHSFIFTISLFGAILLYHFAFTFYLPFVTLPFPILSPYIYMVTVLLIFGVAMSLFRYSPIAQSGQEKDIEKIVARYIGALYSGILLIFFLASLLFLFSLDTVIKQQLRKSFIASLAMSTIQRVDISFQSLTHTLSYSVLGFFSVDPEYNGQISLPFPKKGSSEDAKLERKLVEEINQERRRSKLPAFIHSEILDEEADNHVKDMISHQYFAYKTYNGPSIVTRLEVSNVRFSKASESIALVQTLDGAVYGFISTSHNADNMLSKGFNSIGVSVYDVGPLGLLVSVVVTD